MRMFFFQKKIHLLKFLGTARNVQVFRSVSWYFRGFFGTRSFYKLVFVQNIFFFILHILLAPCFMHYRHRICRELKYLNCKYQEVNKLHSLILFISTIYVSSFLFLNDFRVCENFYFYHFYDFNTFIKSPCLQISSMAL